MNEITCPHCSKAFKVDEAGYAAILKQVRNHEFETELHERLAAAEHDKDNAVKLAQEKLKNELHADVAKKDTELATLKAEMQALHAELEAKKDAEIARLHAERDAIAAKLESKIEHSETEKKLAVSEALAKVEKERDDLANKLTINETQQQLFEKSLREKFEIELKSKDEAIAYYKDMKAKLSTKMIGESLEQHCEIEFNKLRATAFPNAYFEKDNDASTGSKGDYIYRETDGQGTEIISIMFEMKNEGDETAAKKRNDDFLRELNKDREEKKCEYAVLVSLLESDNELYNSGIVDMSHKHPKMYVIRPQFFIPMITLLRNAAMNSMKYKSELALVKAQNIDVTNFENHLHDFRESFGKSYRLASERFQDAVASIDKSIAQLQKTKDNLLKSEDHYRIAHNKADDLTVKKLTRGNPTMKKMFDDVNRS